VTLKLASIVPVWILVLAATLTVAVLTEGLTFFTWQPIVLGIQRKDGFNDRLALSAGGAFVIVATAAIILWVVR
jgi:fumarate reductase subunit C